MNPPPRPALPSESAGKARQTQPSPDDELLAIRGQGLRPSLSPNPQPEVESSPDISPRTLPAASLTPSRPKQAGIGTHDSPSDDDLLPLPRSTSPEPANPRSTAPSPDELIYTMPQYQPVSAGSTGNPRAMSQVSPGFIFVNFLSQSVCCFSSLNLP